MDEKKKGGLSLILGIGGKPKAEEADEDEGRAACGKALISAIKRGDGAAVMDALEECAAYMDMGSEDEEPEEDMEDEEA